MAKDTDNTEQEDNPEDTELQETAAEQEHDHKDHNTEVKPTNMFSRLWHAYLANKKLTIPLTILAILTLVLAIPLTRYPLLGTIISRNFSVIVIDSQTGKPVSSADVRVAGKSAKTDANGRASLKVKVGNTQLNIQKKYYKDLSTKVLVPIGSVRDPLRQKIEATGRQVPIVVRNKVTGQPLSNANIAAAGTEVKTGKDGKVTIVLPADKSKQEAFITAEGYNGAKATITVTDKDVADNMFNITPSGKLYFLSKLSGKIDVVKTDLDGTNRQTVLAGTGKEEEAGTVLLASRDWKYLALISRRAGLQARVYLIETANDKLTVIDEGNASFTAVGWSNDKFIYTVNRNTVQLWQAKKFALKSYNASTKNLVTLDETDVVGTGQYYYGDESFGQVYVLDNQLIYTKNWSTYYDSPTLIGNQQAKIISVKPDGTAKTTLKSVGVPDGESLSSLSFDSISHKADAIYFRIYDGANSFYEFEDGKISENKSLDDDKFYNSDYLTYIVSPDGKQSFWSERRDGKNMFFVGDIRGENSKQVATLNEYNPYGWYTDDYLLVSKGGSELYIMSVSGSKTPYKVSDYHKPNYDFRGYGYGYGGF